MPLAVPALQSGLQSVFANPGKTAADCAQSWADAVGSYAAGIVPPSAAVDTAKATLAGALTTAFGTPNAIPGMEAAFAAFGAAVGLGMAGYAPVPPAGPVGFAAQFGGAKPSSHADAAQQIAARIDTWMKTGSATLIAPPFTVVPWS